MKKTKTIAGGRAVEAGMAFQSGVGTWLAAHIISKESIGSRFGADTTIIAETISFETQKGFDDISIRLPENGEICFQCKTSLNLSDKNNTEFQKTIFQLVDQFFLWNENTHTQVNAPTYIAVLAISSNAPSTLSKLHDTCRMFDMSGEWDNIFSQLSDEKQTILSKFRN